MSIVKRSGTVGLALGVFAALGLGTAGAYITGQVSQTDASVVSNTVFANYDTAATGNSNHPLIPDVPGTLIVSVTNPTQRTAHVMAFGAGASTDDDPASLCPAGSITTAELSDPFDAPLSQTDAAGTPTGVDAIAPGDSALYAVTATFDTTSDKWASTDQSGCLGDNGIHIVFSSLSVSYD